MAQLPFFFFPTLSLQTAGLLGPQKAAEALLRVPIHDIQIGPDSRSQVHLVDDQQIRLRDTSAPWYPRKMMI